jgi:predicted secreted hydrolase
MGNNIAVAREGRVRVWKWLAPVLALAAVAGAVALGWLLSGRRSAPATQGNFFPPASDGAGFSRADGTRRLAFPADYGPHPDFQTEWWYYTGNLDADGGRHFGYQLTFFRRALLPSQERIARPSNWATQAVYMAHLAISDVSAGRFDYEERFGRGAAGLASAQATPYRVWLEDWSVGDVGGAEPARQLKADGAHAQLDLRLVALTDPVLHGDAGYSRKGSERGNASYYYSLPRLESSGVIAVAGRTYAVKGMSWMDHEFSTAALAGEQVGWDWFALQLDDGHALMVFRLRRADGSLDAGAAGTWVDAAGKALPLQPDEFSIESQGTWRSPHSGATYPAKWSIRVPPADLVLDVEPYLADQELRVSFTYWEGAVRVSGRRAGRAVQGQGYVELTGYAGSMRGQF